MDLKAFSFFVAVMLPTVALTRPYGGDESDKLQVQLVGRDVDKRILTLRVTNKSPEPYVFAAFELEPVIKLRQPEFWMYYPDPDFGFLPEDLRKGSYDKADHRVVLNHGESMKCEYYLHDYRLHVDYWFYDAAEKLRFKIENKIEQNAAGQPAPRPESK